MLKTVLVGNLRRRAPIILDRTLNFSGWRQQASRELNLTGEESTDFERMASWVYLNDWERLVDQFLPHQAGQLPTVDGDRWRREVGSLVIALGKKRLVP